MMKFKIALLTILALLLLGCSSDDNSKGTIQKKPTLEFKVKQKQLLIQDKANLLYDLVVNNNLNIDDIQWNSSNIQVVSVEKGILQAKQFGEVIITARVKNTQESATIKVIVSDVRVSFKQEETQVDVSKSNILDLNSLLNLENVSHQDLIWSDSEDGILLVDGKGMVKAIKNGYGLVHVRVKNKQNITATIRVKVFNAGVEQLYFNFREPENAIWLNQEYTYTLTAYPSDSDLSGLVWTSSDKAIATVNNQGVVKANALGKVTISVVAPNGVKANVDVKIITGDITSVSLIGNNQKIINGESLLLYFTTAPKESSTSLLSFVSSDPSIARVDQKGLVTAVKGKRGRVTISVASKKDPHIKDSYEIEVVSMFSNVDSKTHLTGSKQGTIVTGDVVFSIMQYDKTSMEVSDLKVYDKFGTLLYHNTSSKTLQGGMPLEYNFKLNKANTPYVSYQLKYEDHEEARTEVLKFL